MCAKWTVKHEIMGQLLWFLLPLLWLVAMMMVFSFINHPYWSAVGFIGVVLGGGVYIWKRKR
jgi:hypothetical protein